MGWITGYRRLPLLESLVMAYALGLMLFMSLQDETTQFTFDPLDFIVRIAALSPASRAHLVCYRGVFAPASPLRSVIVHVLDEEALDQLISSNYLNQILCLNSASILFV